jgi:malate dehydrogenase
VRYASVSGIPITELLEKQQIEKILTLTRGSGSDVIRLKGATTYAPAAVIAIMADAVLKGRNRVMGISTCLQGEYGFSNISVGVPCVLGKNGVERILELKLDSDTKAEFAKSVTSVSEVVKKIEQSSVPTFT